MQEQKPLHSGIWLNGTALESGQQSQIHGQVSRLTAQHSTTTLTLTVPPCQLTTLHTQLSRKQFAELPQELTQMHQQLIDTLSMQTWLTRQVPFTVMIGTCRYLGYM